ncbi:MAG: hypothetical protein JXQ75_01910 [Phycisphaerae bacterium]|nr:hypothetical protein [Phycisphaerae bacterium]
MTSRKFILCLVAATLLALPAVVAAQSVEQNKLLARRAAEADAYRKLAECIKGLQITSDTYVKDFVCESDVIQTDLDTFVRGIRLGKPKWDSDLACTVEAEVTVANVIEELKSFHSRHYKGNILKAEDFNQIKKYIKKDVIKAYGMGAPRPDLPPDVPGEELAAPSGMTLPDPVIPDIWKAIPVRERLMAKRAAEVDAMRRLVERIKGLRITSDTLVRDFVAESDVITTEARATLVGAQETRTYWHNDELIVEVTYEVPIESVITTIKSLHKRHYKGDKVTGMDIERVTKELRQRKFEATGMGVPRPQAIRVAAEKLEMSIPDWVGQTIRAEGNGVPRSDLAGTPQGKLMAARAAELDAKRRLAEEVMGFQIDSSTTVRDFVTEHDEINTQLNAYIVGSYVKSTTYDSEGTATVMVEMPAMQVWEVVHTYMRVERM